jgi:hypothetical protein
MKHVGAGCLGGEFYNHLIDRGWAPYLRSWVDWEHEIVTFPLWVPGGKLIGYQRYIWNADKLRDNNSKGRYFTWVADTHKKCYVYGYDSVFGCGPLFVTEGVWDCVKVHINWFDCVATLTSTPHKQTKQWLRFIAGRRPIVAIADNDGVLGRGWADEVVHINNYKDIGDMPREEAGQLLKEVCDGYRKWNETPQRGD